MSSTFLHHDTPANNKSLEIMKRLHSYVDGLGEARFQAVLLCFDFSQPPGEDEGTHCSSDADGCGAGWKCFHSSFWVSTPSSDPPNDYGVQVGQNKKELLLHGVLFFSFVKQALDMVVF